jgi:glutamate racemase
MSAPVGILDSGIGGLSVLREIRRLLPHEALLFVADQGHLPYGPRSLHQVRRFAEGITRFLLANQAKVIVIACNTASAAALHHLRQVFPQVAFVGMEPAIRPAARATQTGVIGVIATAATFQGELYASLIDRFAQGVQVITRACPELVTLAERGAPWTPVDQQLVSDLLAGFRATPMDQLVLGCTHFPFLTPLLQTALGQQVTIVDPAPAVARQLERVLHAEGQLAPPTQIGTVHYLTSGDPQPFTRQISSLLAIPAPLVSALQWQGDDLRYA